MSDKQINTQEVVLHLLRIGLGAEDSIPAVSDWDAVFEVATREGVMAIVFDGYVKLFDAGAEIPQMPVPVKKKWIGSVYSVETSVARQEKTASKMALFFASNHIRTYVLKGSIIAECYPIPQHRRSVDLDCFLLPETGQVFDAWEKGNDLIESRGFHVSRGFYKNSTFLLPGLTVENHIYLTPFRGNKRLKKLEQLLQQLLRADSGIDQIDGTNLYRPPVMVSALFLVEHAFSHFLHEGLNLRHITDWMMFSRYHKDDIDWPLFNRYIDEYGFRRFYDAYVHVGEFVVGTRSYSDLSAIDRRMLSSIMDGINVHPERDPHTFRAKIGFAMNTIRSSWKYKAFSDITMLHALWIQVKGFLFIKHPTLD